MEKYWRYRLVSLISQMSVSCQPAVNTHVVISQRATLRTFWFVSETRGMRTLYYQKSESRDMNNALQVCHSLFLLQVSFIHLEKWSKDFLYSPRIPFSFKGLLFTETARIWLWRSH